MSSNSRVVLCRGDHGPAVADVIDRLVITHDLPADFPRGAADARFDDTVHSAVLAFQQRRGLIADGIVGPATYAVLDGARWQLGDRVLRFQPDHLLEGDDVGRLQTRLVELGFRPGKVDGIHGPDTDRGVRAFQAAMGLDVDGVIGPETLRTLNQLGRSVRGGSANALREKERLRRSGYSLSGRTIVIDPGHGGSDVGSCGNGLVEADLVLDLARRVEGRLSAHGVEVVFTRTSTFESGSGSEEDRAALCNSVSADLVLSLHTDHSVDTAGQGVSTYFYGMAEHPQSASWSVTGERFADVLCREIVARTGLTDCRSHPRAWTLLRRTKMPAVRLDVGYLTSAQDAATLADPRTLDVIADAVVVALQRLYLGEDDTVRTGVLKLDDLRRHLESVSRPV